MKLALLLLSLLGSASAALVDRVAAVVNDEVITLSQVYDLGGDFIEQRSEQSGGDPYARREAELEVLDSIILRRLVAQEMARLSLEMTEEEVDARLDDWARQNGLTREQLREEVERQGLVWVDYRSEFKETLRQQRFNAEVIYPRIKVDEDELKDAYRRMVSSADLPQVLDLGAIFLAWPEGGDEAARQAVRDRALQVAARVRGGEDFATVAATEDQGPYGAHGGRMGTFQPGELVPALEDPTKGLPVGGLSEPVEMPQGIFLLYVFDRRTADAKPFEEVRDQVFGQVYETRVQDETYQWYQQQRRKAAISVKLEPPPGP